MMKNGARTLIGELTVELLTRRLLHGRVEGGDGRVVDQDVQWSPSESIFEGGEQRVDVAVDTELGAHREGPPARGLDRGDGVGRRGFVASVVDGDLRTVAGQPFGDGTADSPRCPGYQCGLAR